MSLYDRLGRSYDRLAASEHPLIAEGIRRLELCPGERVLEIGSGSGWGLGRLAEAVQPDGLALGVDLSMGMLGVARTRLGRSGAPAGLARANGLRLPLPPASFEAVFLSFTLELFPDPDWPSVLGECRRVLRPGGRLGVVTLLQVPNPGWMSRLYFWFHARFPTVIDCRPIPLEAWLSQAGFQLSYLDVHSLWGLPVGVAIGKR